MISQMLISLGFILPISLFRRTGLFMFLLSTSFQFPNSVLPSPIVGGGRTGTVLRGLVSRSRDMAVLVVRLRRGGGGVDEEGAED